MRTLLNSGLCVQAKQVGPIVQRPIVPVGPYGVGPSTYKTVDGEYLLLGELVTSVDN